MDLLFIIFLVPESLGGKSGLNAGGKHSLSLDEMSWHNADPFLILRIVGEDRTVFRLATIVFLSYLPEAGQFSCFFVYLKLVGYLLAEFQVCFLFFMF